jgi:hypothetical protein
VGVEKTHRLLPVRWDLGGIQIQHDLVPVRGQRADVFVFKRSGQLDYRARGHGMLEARQRRLRAQGVVFVDVAVAGDLPHRVAPQRRRVVLILVSHDDLEHALT